MSRIGLAFLCFFALLFGRKLPARAAGYLPEGERPAALPEAAGEDAKGDGAAEAGAADGATDGATEPGRKSDRAGSGAKAKVKPARSALEPPRVAELHREGALAVLGLLQREGRLVDFLQESIDDYDDADIGAAVRDIHRGCKLVLSEHLVIEPVMPGDEDDEVTIPKGFDPGEVRLVGEAKGDPPFKGVLRHHGWRVVDVTLPALSDGVDRRIVAPAEVELPRG